MLAIYRKHCATPSSAGQLILPECMKLLPLYINCLLKSDALSGGKHTFHTNYYIYKIINVIMSFYFFFLGADMTIDDRSHVMQAVATMPIFISIAYTYPRLFPLHDIDPQDTELPSMLRCSIDKFTDDGAYLLGNIKMIYFSTKTKIVKIL